VTAAANNATLSTTMVEAVTKLTTFFDLSTEAFSASNKALENFDNRYKEWVNNLRAVTDILTVQHGSAIAVSYETTQLINTAKGVVEEMRYLMSDTSAFQIWLDEALTIFEKYGDVIATLTKSLAHNLELREAQTPLDIEMREKSYQQGQYALYASVGAVLVSLIGVVVNRPREVKPLM